MNHRKSGKMKRLNKKYCNKWDDHVVTTRTSSIPLGSLSMVRQLAGNFPHTRVEDLLARVATNSSTSPQPSRISSFLEKNIRPHFFEATRINLFDTYPLWLREGTTVPKKPSQRKLYAALVTALFHLLLCTTQAEEFLLRNERLLRKEIYPSLNNKRKPREFAALAIIGSPWWSMAANIDKTLRNIVSRLGKTALVFHNLIEYWIGRAFCCSFS